MCYANIICQRSQKRFFGGKGLTFCWEGNYDLDFLLRTQVKCIWPLSGNDCYEVR